ncbi:NFACT RNA binding domain-containing protein [Aquiflexum sp. LQ15W]|uniref:NFACT RNA binding domain-containing protein n=1 Tax=Cognataquiflexum nitidum TaxID=2922272 RepID=UPI001F137B24|nr:NFACT RNA binding domain-containing protein [Cognataquiflexum nitidum]MCH6199561.1 NFACT RNA binding domain-containing protein [Cognataquiflexum nitidum]
MHFNFHFLKFLCPELDTTFSGAEIVECFSQNKDELVIGCSKDGRDVFIRANLLPSVSCLSFPDNFKRSKRNTVSLFPEIIGKKIHKIEVVNFERAFIAHLDSGDKILFKLHGTRSNILFYPKEQDLPSLLFRNELKDDKNVLVSDLSKNLRLDRNTFISLEGNASKFLPTLGKIPREWLKNQGYIEAGLEEKWELMQELLDMLESPLYAIINDENEYLLSLLPEKEAMFKTSDPIKVCNELFRYRVVIQSFEKEKQTWQRQLQEQQKRTRSYIAKTGERLEQLLHETPPSQVADVIMANLHAIDPNFDQVKLFNFYSSNEEVFKLKVGQSPQKYAENLYRKSKNRKKEIEQLSQNLAEKEKLSLQTASWLEEIEGFKDFRSLRDFVKNNHLTPKSKEQEEQVPFKRFEIEGFEVLVGKSAKSNDDMLRNFAWKEDLWLHAKDVSGSHVLIKYRSGINFPKTVLERAAELAAYYSKNKNESLSPVMYTPAKYVRKVKGAAPGAVMVEKENVLMVKPTGPTSS